MKRLVSIFAILVGWTLAASAAGPAPLATLRAIHDLTHAEAGKNLPVTFEATVTYRRAGETTLFVQDGGAAIYVWAKEEFKMNPGDRVLVRGKAQDSFRPIVVADDVTVLGHGSLPAPVPATFDQLIHSELDCMRVTVRAQVYSADLVKSGYWLTTHMRLLANGGIIEAYINSSDSKLIAGLLDADVEVTGVATARFDGKMQHTGAGLAVPSFSDMRILKRSERSPWSLPVSPMGDILYAYHVNILSQRVRVHGTITYYQPGSALVLQDGARSLWVMTTIEEPLRVGSQADVSGFPDVHDGFLALAGGEVRQTAVYAPVAPRSVSWSQLTSSRNVFDLVKIEGQVVSEVRESSQDEYVLVSGGHMFSAIYRHPQAGDLQLPPQKQIPLGSRVGVTGICILENSNPFDHEVPFSILMRTPDDITVVARPSPINVRNLILMVGLLLTGLIGLGFRSWALERRIRRHTAALATLERQRSRILEDINGSRPLAEILEEIMQLVSLKLKGAPCWCQIADGARLGNCPEKTAALRVIQEEIPARSGPSLGTILAALEPLGKPAADDAEALSMGAELATLAIETRRLYSDLRHRSEFDLLTDILNRFSLETRLDAQIDEARQQAGIFGLIYIDLDKFKQVNDLYGHQTGDLYLQEVALRMKRQLRSADLLARLGGDEFAALVPAARNRAEVEEIAQRLERCFDEPFEVEGHVLHGSASVGIALYPEDGATRDSVLNAADAAMYEAKHSKR